MLNLSKDEGEISPHEAEASVVTASSLWVEITTIKEPTVPDIEWHGRLFAIPGVMSYARGGASHT